MNEIQLHLKKAETTLAEAEYLLVGEFYSATVSRSYYAGFYAVQAILYTKEIYAKTHQGVLIMFNKHFIKTGIFEPYLSKYLKNNLDQRLIGDYEIGFGMDKDDAKHAIERAKEIIKTIKEYISNEKNDTDLIKATV